MTTHEAALHYAGKGWRVFPIHTPVIHGDLVLCSCGRADCGSVGKHPRTEHGLSDATTDPATIDGWWMTWPDANVGVVTGVESGIVVIDADGKAGLAAVYDLVKQHGPLPRSPRAKTGGGGKHAVFAHPGGDVRLPNTAGKLAEHVDTRGDGGYIVAPPSLHRSGVRYEWVGADGPDVEIAPLPDWVRRVWERASKPSLATPAGAFTLPSGPASDDAGYYWLGKALARATFGNRNDVGLWLATQLRDAGLGAEDAAAVMRQYAARVPAGDRAYTEREAMATLRSAWKRPPRERAATQSVGEIIIRSLPPQFSGDAASTELNDFLEGIIAGKIYNAGFPQELLTKCSNALLPGTVTMLSGDPGVGKTYTCLQWLQYWFANAYNPAALFVEKDKKFYLWRLLAQLECNGEFVKDWWIKQNPDKVRDAMRRHAALLDAIGTCIHAAPAERLTLDKVLVWATRQAEAGSRVILIDPITAVSGGDKRFLADEDFMVAAQQVMTAYGASLILTTHPQKAKTGGDVTATSGNMANGAAYGRFADTVIWIHKPKEPRVCAVRIKSTPFPDVRNGPVEMFVELQKTRLGPGGGKKLAVRLGNDLLLHELGIIDRDLKGQEAREADDVEFLAAA